MLSPTRNDAGAHGQRSGGPPARPEVLVGVDFGGPATAAAQRRKILAVAAERLADRRYAVGATGLNARLTRKPPGWTAGELAEALISDGSVPSIVGADFPFCVPCALLDERSFAIAVGHAAALRDWQTFNDVVSARLRLTCPVDYAPFRGWRSKEYWLKRDTDVLVGAHAALKDRFQVLFNMTLLGNAFLAALVRSGKYDVVPFQSRGRSQAVEVYPGHAMRALGVRDYKRAPARAMTAMLAHLAAHGITVTVDAAIRTACETYDSGRGPACDHDAADAFVALCIAILKREGLACEMVGARRGSRKTEGAIWSIASPERRVVQRRR